MNIQQMMAQAQKMQREMQKAQDELAKKEFVVSSNGGAVTVTVLGSRQIQKIDIDKDMLNPDDKEMIEEIITMSLNNALEQIDAAFEAINDKVSAKMPGF